MSEMPRKRRDNAGSAGSDSGPHTPPHSGMLPYIPQMSPLTVEFNTDRLSPRQGRNVPAAYRGLQQSGRKPAPTAADAGQRTQRKYTDDELRNFNTDRPVGYRKPVPPRRTVPAATDDAEPVNTAKQRERRSKFKEHLDSDSNIYLNARRLGTLGPAERVQDYRDVTLQALEGAPDTATYRTNKPLPPLPKPLGPRPFPGPQAHSPTAYQPFTPADGVSVATRPRANTGPSIRRLNRTDSFEKLKQVTRQVTRKLSLTISDTFHKIKDNMSPTSKTNDEIDDLRTPTETSFDIKLAERAYLADEVYQTQLEVELSEYQTDVFRDGLRDAWKEQEQADRLKRINRRAQRERDGESIHENESDFSFFAGKRDPQAKYKRGLLRLYKARMEQERVRKAKLAEKEAKLAKKASRSSKKKLRSQGSTFFGDVAPEGAMDPCEKCGRTGVPLTRGKCAHCK